MPELLLNARSLVQALLEAQCAQDGGCGGAGVVDVPSPDRFPPSTNAENLRTNPLFDAQISDFLV